MREKVLSKYDIYTVGEFALSLSRFSLRGDGSVDPAPGEMAGSEDVNYYVPYLLSDEAGEPTGQSVTPPLQVKLSCSPLLSELHTIYNFSLGEPGTRVGHPSSLLTVS